MVDVCVRVRALNNADKESGATKVVRWSEGKVTVSDKTYPIPGYGPDTSPEEFYNASVAGPIKQGITRGIDVGVLCIGHSNTGKSETVADVVAQAATPLFTYLHAQHSSRYFVGVSYLNIYQDKLTDLLNPSDKQLKVKSHPDLGQYVHNLSEISVKSAADLLRLFDQGNKVRKILELEMNIPATHSHTVIILSVEHKHKDTAKLIRSQIQVYNISGLEHDKQEAVAGSLKALDTLISQCISTDVPTGYNASKLTQMLKCVLNKKCYFSVIGQLSPTSADGASRTLDLLTKAHQIPLQPTPSSLDIDKTIADLRKRVTAARNAITAASTGNVPKEHIAELDSSLEALKTAKRLQWSERELASDLAEEQRRHTLADQGILEWVTETYQQQTDSGGKVLILQKEKDQSVNEYKKQRKIVEDLKTDLQRSISSHTDLAAQPNQTEAALRDSLSKIHTLRDALKVGNESLRELKKNVKDNQDKLKLERSLGRNEEEVEGNFELSYMIRCDEMMHLKRDNALFLQEEQERVQSTADQEIAEVKLAAAQGKVLTLEDVVKLQEQLAAQTAQLAYLALHVQCLHAENEKLSDTLESVRTAHKTEAETQKMRNLLTFRQYKDFYEEAKSATNSKYAELLNSAIQDAIFLSARNEDLSQENTDLKRKLKHFS